METLFSQKTQQNRQQPDSQQTRVGKQKNKARAEIKKMLANRLREERELRGISLNTLAVELDLRPKAVSFMETAQQVIPAELLPDWLAALDIDFEDILIASDYSQRKNTFKMSSYHCRLFDLMSLSKRKIITQLIESLSQLHQR